MELLGESHLDVAEDNYKVVPLRDGLLLLSGPRYVNVIKLGDSVLFSRQLDDTNKRNIFRYLQSTNKILHVGKDNTVKILSPTHQGIFIFGDTLNDSAIRISFQESLYLLETLQSSDMNWGPDTEELSQRVEGFLQNRIPEFQLQPQKKQQWLECVLEGTYSDLEPLLEDISSQSIQDSSDESATINKMLQRIRYNASHHLKHPSAEPVVSAAVSPTEEIAVTASADGNIAIWDISKIPRLVNTIRGPDGLVEVLLGEVVVTVHRPNVVVVHQIGEHALSETLFQQSLDGVVIMGAAYALATQKVVLAVNVIGSPAKECYFLQTVSVNLEDRSLELSERVRVDGSFVAIVGTNGTNTVSIDAEGQVVLFDSSSGEISNIKLKKPQSNYRFSDVTSSKSGHIYAVTLAGTVLSFNLASIPRNSTSASASPPAFSQAPTTDSDPFGDFSAPQGGNDDDFGFGDFASSTPANNATPQHNNNNPFPSEDGDEFGFGGSSFTTPSAAALPSTELSPKFSMDEHPGAGIAGSVAAHNNSTGDFGELPRLGAGSVHNSPVVGASKLRQSFDFQESPYSSPLQSRKSPPPTDFGQFTANTTPPAERKSPQLNSAPQQTPSTNQEPFSFGRQEPFGSQEPFGNFGSQEQFGDFGSQGQVGSQEQFGDFGSQEQFGDFGAIPPAQSNGLASSQHPPAPQEQFKGDFGNFEDFTGETSSFGQSDDFGDFSQPTSTQQNVGNLGDFSTGTSSTSPPLSTSPPANNLHSSTGSHSPPPLHSSTNLHSPTLRSSTSSHTSAPSTPGLPSNFRVSASILPASPSIFSQDFGFDTPPATSLSQSGPYSPPPTKQSTDTTDFGGDFGTNFAPPTQTSPTFQRAASPKSEPENTFGDFGTNFTPTSQTSPTFQRAASPKTEPESTLGDFGTDFASPTFQTSPKFQRDQGTTSPKPDTFGDFGSFASTTQTSPKPQRDLGASSPKPDTFGDFGTNFVAPPTHTSPKSQRDLGASSPKPETFGDFGNFATNTQTSPKSQRTTSPKPDTFGDFGTDFEAPITQTSPKSQRDQGATSPKPQTGDFGDFGTSFVAQTSPKPQRATSPKAEPETETLGDFGELSTSSPQIHRNDEDFSFSAPSTAQENEGFGDFGDNPATTTQTEDFGDFGETTPAGDFSETVTRERANTFGDFGESSPTAQNEGFGDFGESPAAPTESFGDFGESPTTAQQTSESFGDFGQSTNEAAPQSAEDDFGDFGDFSAPAEQKGDDDDFGDFGDFSKPQEANDDDFGDFGGFSGATSTENQSTNETETTATPAAAPVPTPTPTPTPTPVPQTPSIFSQDEKQLEQTLKDTFTNAFASLVPPAINSPSSRRASVLTELDLEASLKGQDNKDSPVSRNPKCTQCGILLRSADASSCLACGAPAGPPQVSTWIGVVLPPIAEIKFWDALGVPLKQMTESNRMPPSMPALSSSQGILTPMAATPITPTPQSTLPSTQTTQPTLSSSWDFSENPFAPNKATKFEFGSTTEILSAASGSAAKPPASTPATTNANSSAKPAQHATQSAQPSTAQVGFGGDDFMGSPFPSSTPTTGGAAGTSSFQTPATGSSRPSTSSTPAPRSADDDFFLSFESSSNTTPTPKPTIPSILTAPSASTPSTPWSQFLSRIPDLSFAVADKLVIPSH